MACPPGAGGERERERERGGEREPPARLMPIKKAKCTASDHYAKSPTALVIPLQSKVADEEKRTPPPLALIPFSFLFCPLARLSACLPGWLLAPDTLSHQRREKPLRLSPVVNPIPGGCRRADPPGASNYF